VVTHLDILTAYVIIFGWMVALVAIVAYMKIRRSEEIGRLRATSEMVETIRDERDKAVRELAQLKTDLELRISEEVKAALQRAQKEHEQAAAQWAQEKEKYLAEIEALNANLEQTGVKGYILPTDLATKFAEVIEMQAASQPAPGRQYSAALTSMEVEARGVLQSPREDEKQPRFYTVESGKVDPATLSTLRMTFKVLPHLAAPEE
jgi:hypothetical protein